jgi:hypothetical protein
MSVSGVPSGIKVVFIFAPKQKVKLENRKTKAVKP